LRSCFGALTRDEGIENPVEQRLSMFGVSDTAGVYLGFVAGQRDDPFIDVTKAEALGDQSSDCLSVRTEGP
jgi:hypothetical protein